MITNWINQSSKMVTWLDEEAVIDIVAALDSRSGWNRSTSDLLTIVASHNHLVSYTPDAIIEAGSGAYFCDKFITTPEAFLNQFPSFLRNALKSAIFKVKKFDTDDSNPEVTISICTFNREEECLNAVNSVLQQTYSNIRCLVIKDGPGEYKSLPTDARLEFHALSRPGKYPENGEKRWHIAGLQAFNYANALTRGPILCLLDDDDLYLPDHIETIVEEWLRSKAHVIYTEPSTSDGKAIFDFDFDRQRLEKENFIFSCTTAYCGAALAISYTPPYADFPGDWTALKRMSEAGLKFSKVKKVTTVHGEEEPSRARTRAREAYLAQLKLQQEQGESGE